MQRIIKKWFDNYRFCLNNFKILQDAVACFQMQRRCLGWCVGMNLSLVMFVCFCLFWFLQNAPGSDLAVMSGFLTLCAFKSGICDHGGACRANKHRGLGSPPNRHPTLLCNSSLFVFFQCSKQMEDEHWALYVFFWCLLILNTYFRQISCTFSSVWHLPNIH